MLSEKWKSTLKKAAHKLTGYKKRAFMAEVTEDYFNGSPRKAETQLGWSRQAIATGLKERETGILCADNYQARGRKKTEEILPKLEADIKTLVETYSQADPKFKSTFAYAKVSARAVREALIKERGYSSQELPCRQTIGEILNRMGYRLKKHKRSNP
ncbi:hypothetical protein VB834_17215 [Limnoraphis robusta Tam1]|nr:hypothetical protein [Limnoraphis robusta]MEA5495953.1 hypothetical protein [Limnoraphis robusta BA-68 BA1]MEA5540762.1 hypothetical protein [Limnoraphis robusta Tam1]